MPVGLAQVNGLDRPALARGCHALPRTLDEVARKHLRDSRLPCTRHRGRGQVASGRAVVRVQAGQRAVGVGRTRRMELVSEEVPAMSDCSRRMAARGNLERFQCSKRSSCSGVAVRMKAS